MKNRTNLNYFLNLADKGFVVGIALIIAFSMLLSGCDSDDESVPCNENPNLTHECVQEGTGYSGKYSCGIDGVTLICEVPKQPSADKPCSSRPNLNAECGAKVGSDYVPGHFECADPTAKVDPVCTPDDGSEPDPNPTCGHAPADIKLLSYQGCMTSAQLSGAVRDGEGNTQYFHGYPGTDPSKGLLESAELKDDGKTCGPITVSMVSGSGTVKGLLSEAMYIYSLDKTWADWSWQKVYGTSPTASDYDSDAFSDFLIDLFDCEKGSSCAYPVLKGTAPPNAVVEDGITASFEDTGSYCGRLFLILRSK